MGKFRNILSYEEFLFEKEKWSKGISIEKGKMRSLLNIPNDQKIEDVYKSGRELAKALLDKVGNKKEVAGMLAFAANINPRENIFDKALKALKDIEI